MTSAASANSKTFTSKASVSGGNAFSAPAETVTTATTSALTIAPAAAPPASPRTPDNCGTKQQVAPQIRRSRALGFQILQRAALVTKIADNGEQKPHGCERESDESRDKEQGDRAAREWVTRQLGGPSALRGEVERQAGRRPCVEPQLRRARNTGLGGVRGGQPGWQIGDDGIALNRREIPGYPDDPPRNDIVLDVQRHDAARPGGDGDRRGGHDGDGHALERLVRPQDRVSAVVDDEVEGTAFGRDSIRSKPTRVRRGQAQRSG